MATIDDVYDLLLQFLSQGNPYTFQTVGYTHSAYTGSLSSAGHYGEHEQVDYNNSILVFLENKMGLIPDGGVHTIYNEIEDASHGLAAINSNVLTNLTTLDSHDTRMTNYYDLVDESLENAEAQATTAATNSQNLVDNGGNLIMNQAGISLPKFGGGASLISLVQLLSSLISAPPIQLLTQHLEVVFTGDHTLAGAVGVYGATLTISAPPTWGRTSGAAALYIPPVGRYQWVTPDGNFDNPLPIQTNTSVFFPAPADASGLVISLEPGITGTLYSLQLI